jgi:hypothetical protein
MEWNSFIIIIIVVLGVHYDIYKSSYNVSELNSPPPSFFVIPLSPFLIEFYSAIKKSEILSFAGKWMKLENMTLSEVSKVQKAKGCMFSLLCGI